MASPATTIVERADIHKSCKSLETVVNILNDYCEAASAIVTLQKKLTKALRECATTKCSSEIPANAFNSSAAIFEALSEVDTKFAKVADKECDTISDEVKKWFKKLAKEEKAHDDRIANANAKIKQAGLTFEKKSKRNPRDAAEEHTRYINTLSTVGPEVTQEKYNHALLVTQRHTVTMHSVAACLSRVADAEWLRSCEGVRKFAPTVGQLGAWRALCEGGWSGSIPPDLPDLSAPISATDNASNAPRKQYISKPASDAAARSSHELTPPAPEYSSRRSSEQGTAPSRATTPSVNSPVSPPQYPDIPPISGPDRSAPTKHISLEDRKNPSLTSLASLTSFPSPPTHFPLPPIPGSGFKASTSNSDQSLPMTQSPAQMPIQDLTTPTVESPSATTLSSSQISEEPFPSSSSKHSQSGQRKDDPGLGQQNGGESSQVISQVILSSSPRHVSADKAHDVNPALQTAQDASTLDSDKQQGSNLSQPKSTEASSVRLVERSETGKSNGSVVSALRDRYSRNPGSTSPPLKEAPRLPLSVSKLTTRFEPAGSSPTSPRQRVSSPSEDRRRSVDNFVRASQSPTAERAPTNAVPTPTSIHPADAIALRRRRIEELEEIEYREHEHELRLREREIELNARELELERMRLINARGAAAEGYVPSSLPRGQLPQRPSGDASPTLQRPRYMANSYSTTHLVTQGSRTSYSKQSASQPSSPLLGRPTDHAPYCGCELCSASKYGVRDTAPSPRDLRPPGTPITLRPEKPKGWIRRLSMPGMSNAFSLDSKKNASNVGIAGGPGYRSSLVLAEEDGRLQTDLSGGIRNRSTTNLVRR